MRPSTELLGSENVIIVIEKIIIASQTTLSILSVLINRFRIFIFFSFLNHYYDEILFCTVLLYYMSVSFFSCYIFTIIVFSIKTNSQLLLTPNLCIVENVEQEDETYLFKITDTDLNNPIFFQTPLSM